MALLYVLFIIFSVIVFLRVLYLYSLKNGEPITMHCTYAESEKFHSNDSMYPDKGYRCRYTYEYKNEKNIMTITESEIKTNVGEDYIAYVPKNGKTCILECTINYRIKKLINMWGIVGIIFILIELFFIIF